MSGPPRCPANVARGRTCAPRQCDSRVRRLSRPLGSAALLGLALLVAWTYLFLSLHLLQDVDRTHESHCPFAPLAATLSGSGTPPAPVVLVPPAAPVQIDLPANPARPSAAVRFAPNARAPPLLA